MASKKLQNNIDSGLWSPYGNIADDYVVVVGHFAGDRGGFFISFHHGEASAFQYETYNTLNELEARMREFQPDMRKWRTGA